MHSTINKATYFLRLILEYSIYAHCFFLFYDTFSTFKAISIFNIMFTSIILFLIEKKYKNLANPVIILYLLLFLSVILSCFYSINPSYSFSFIRKDFGKAIFVFMAISLFFDISHLKRLFLVFSVSITIYLLSGLFSYIYFDLDFFTSKTFLIDANQNEYACYLAFIFPILIANFFIFNGNLMRFFMLILICSSFGAIILSGTRGAMGAMICTFLIFAFYVSREYIKQIKDIQRANYLRNSVFLLISILITAFILVSFFWQKPLKEHIKNTPIHISTFDNRLNFFWIPALEAIKKRPIFGWGYGNKIYRNEEIFKDTKTKPNYTLKGGLHNTFITILFHQGYLGLIIYVSLLFCCIFYLLNLAKDTNFPQKAILVGLLCIFIGSLIVNAFVISISYLNTAPFFGMVGALVSHRKEITGEI